MDFEGRNSKFKYLSHWHTSGLSSWHGQSRTNCASTFTQRAATTLMFINNIVCKKHTLREKRGGTRMDIATSISRKSSVDYIRILKNYLQISTISAIFTSSNINQNPILFKSTRHGESVYFD